jgi:small subunit ribosomal protein S5
MKKTARERRLARHKRIRRKVFGTPERPRLCVYRSVHHMHAQIIDDVAGHTLVSASTTEPTLRKELKSTGNKEAAAAVGRLIAQRALEKGITQVVFDRGGFLVSWAHRRRRRRRTRSRTEVLGGSMQRKRYSYINPDQLNLHVERVIHTNRVSKTHKGGRTLSFQVMVVVGDTNGHVGVGLGKARQVPDAIRKAIEAARRNLVYVPRVGTTIPHEVEVEYGATRLVLKPASPGTGIVAGSSVRALLEAAGVSDVLAKLVGSRNAINAAWATMEAFRALRTPEEVAQTRGMPLRTLTPWYVRKFKEAAEA